MSTADALAGALDVLETEGWIQGRYANENGVCMARALFKAIDLPWQEGLGVFMRCSRALAEQTGNSNIANWNDKPERTYSEVKEVFRRAIAETGGIAAEQPVLAV